MHVSKFRVNVPLQLGLDYCDLTAVYYCLQTVDIMSITYYVRGCLTCCLNAFLQL